MRALIFRVPDREGVGARDIAGRWLLERQLQWLRRQEIEQVAVEIGPHESDLELASWLLGYDPLVSRVTVVPSEAPLGPEALMARAGFDLDSGVLEMPADLLCETDLREPIARAQSVELELAAPEQAPGAPRLALRFVIGQHEVPREEHPGWGAVIADEQTALSVGCAVLAGELSGPQIHAAQREPGIWIARRARVADDATLIPPVFIGNGAYVAAGATVGPRAVVGPDAAIERGAVVTEGRVRAETLVGEGVHVRRAVAGPHGFHALTDDRWVEVGDALMLDSRHKRVPVSWSSRAVALLLLLLLALPWLIGATIAPLFGRRAIVGQQWPDGSWLRNGGTGLGLLDLWPRLIDVVLGHRFLLGAAAPVAAYCPAAIDVGRGLGVGVPPGVRSRLWAWYAYNKSPKLDWFLLTRH